MQFLAAVSVKKLAVAVIRTCGRQGSNCLDDVQFTDTRLITVRIPVNNRTSYDYYMLLAL